MSKNNEFRTMPVEADFIFENNGTVITVTPGNAAAQAFADAAISIEDWQWIGNSFAVDARYARSLFDSLVKDGFGCIAIGGFLD